MDFEFTKHDNLRSSSDPEKPIILVYKMPHVAPLNFTLDSIHSNHSKTCLLSAMINST